MGSLMAGWNSPVLRSKPDMYKRNLSLTKEEIEAYWRSKNQSDPHHSITHEISTANENSGGKLEKSTSFPIATTKDDKDTDDQITSPHKIITENGWWTMSSWAFLNEPPEDASTSNTTYASQFHVPSSTPKTNARDPIST